MTTRARPLAILLIVLLAILAAPWAAPHDPSRQYSRFPYAPPMRPHLIDDEGRWHAPFAYAIHVVDPIERRYEEDRRVRVPVWTKHTSSAGPDLASPAFLLGADGLGRDILSRTLVGARLSLGVAFLSTALALLLAAACGALAGYAGGWLDSLLMRVAEFILVLPAVYVALALRGALPLVLSVPQVFAALVLVFGLVGWPSAARGVRAIVRVETGQEYAEAARALGASPGRVLFRHLVPATFGFLIVQATLLVPAFVMAEATLSFAGFGFTPPTPSWGAMLQDAAAVHVVASAPWLLTPACAILAAVLLVQALGGARNTASAR